MAFLAVLGKRVIHPTGRASTGGCSSRPPASPREGVLDIRCGVAAAYILRAASEPRMRTASPSCSSRHIRRGAAAVVLARGQSGQVSLGKLMWLILRMVRASA